MMIHPILGLLPKALKKQRRKEGGMEGLEERKKRKERNRGGFSVFLSHLFRRCDGISYTEDPEVHRRPPAGLPAGADGSLPSTSFPFLLQQEMQRNIHLLLLLHRWHGVGRRPSASWESVFAAFSE